MAIPQQQPDNDARTDGHADHPRGQETGLSMPVATEQVERAPERDRRQNCLLQQAQGKDPAPSVSFGKPRVAEPPGVERESASRAKRTETCRDHGHRFFAIQTRTPVNPDNLSIGEAVPEVADDHPAGATISHGQSACSSRARGSTNPPPK